MLSAGRKVRSDKKRDVKPTVDVSVYDTISRISYITNTPMKDVAEVFCMNGLYSLKVIETFEFDFRRAYCFNLRQYPKLFPGNPDKIGQRAVKEPGIKRRLTIRFSQDMHDQLAEFAYALDVTVSSATTLLLVASIKETQILNQYLNAFIEENLDPQRKQQLKEVLKFVAQNNPYENDVTLRTLLGFLFDEVWEYGKNFKKELIKWLDQTLDKE